MRDETNGDPVTGERVIYRDALSVAIWSQDWARGARAAGDVGIPVPCDRAHDVRRSVRCHVDVRLIRMYTP